MSSLDDVWAKAGKYEGLGITPLTGLQGIRKRPEMFFGARVGDPDLPGQVLWVVVRDALAEEPVNPTLTVSVVVESDLVFCVEDDGPGLHVDPARPRRPPWALETLTALTVPKGPRGTLAMATAVCSAVVADVWRDGQHWRQWADWQPQPPLQLVGPTDRHGTRVRCHLDPAYFGAHAALPHDIPGLLANLLDAAPSHAALSTIDRRAAAPPPQ